MSVYSPEAKRLIRRAADTAISGWISSSDRRKDGTITLTCVRPENRAKALQEISNNLARLAKFHQPPLGQNEEEQIRTLAERMNASAARQRRRTKLQR
jgi:hypothetical protein